MRLFNPKNPSQTESIQPYESPSLTAVDKNLGKSHLPKRSKDVFHLDDRVRDVFHLAKDEEDFIAQEIEKRLKPEREKAIAEGNRIGYEAGFQAGQSAGMEEFRESSRPAFNKLMEFVDSVENGIDRLFEANQNYILQLIQTICTNVILRELKTDPDYILRVIRTMVKDIKTRDHLRVMISQEDYSRVEELRADLIQNFGDLKNLSIEVDSTLSSGESKIETEQLLFDSTRAGQSAAIFEKLMSEFGNESGN